MKPALRKEIFERWKQLPTCLDLNLFTELLDEGLAHVTVQGGGEEFYVSDFPANWAIALQLKGKGQP